MITGMPTTARATATEIAERHEEKMLMLGPVLERLNAEMNDRLIAMTFDRMVQVGMLPPVPQELQGIDLNVEFVSILAQAQRAVATNAVDRFTQNLGMLVARRWPLSRRISERLKPPFPRLRCRLCRETFSQPPPSRSWGSSRVIDPVGA